MAEREEKRRGLSPVIIGGIAAGVAAAIGLGVYVWARGRIPEPPPGQATLYGKVTDVVTGEAILGVRVALDGLVTYTDSGGNYALTNIDPGQYVLEFSRAGYEPEVY